MISPALVHRGKKVKVSPGRNAGRILVKILAPAEIDLDCGSTVIEDDCDIRSRHAGRNAGRILA